ncbi:MAG: methyltransferase [Acidobacteria bacterium]|nr:methyltransferase [Acidobacteriota bacterium]MDA1234060.1 methyltransferase [Acidobacteriota bacterium]
MEVQPISEKMRLEWDERARENAYHYVASGREEWSEEEFDHSGFASTEHVVIADLARIAGERDPKELTVLEIGCGAGRMTRSIAEIFGHVHAVDVSGEMLARARARLADIENVSWTHTNGVDLDAIGDVWLDFALSYIVFQHIPDIEVIRGYIREVALRLKPDALFKFQVQGSPGAAATPNDTWFGARFSALDAVRAARENKLQIEDFAGVGEQYFWLTMRKVPKREPDPQVEQTLLEVEFALLEAEQAVLEAENEALKRSTHAAEVALRDLRQSSDDKAEELRAHIRQIYSGWAYRIGRRLGLAPPMIKERDAEK